MLHSHMNNFPFAHATAKKGSRLLTLLMAFSCVLGGFSAHADDDDDDHDDDHRGRRYSHERKEKFRDGHCKVEREWKKDGSFEEERKCKGPSRYVVAQPATATVMYPPWIVVEHGAPTYHPQHVPSVQPVGVLQCKSREVGQALGGVVGGILGNQIGKGSGRAVTTVGGAIAGVLLGGEVGSRIDANDQACMGHVLEFATVGRPVQWAGTAQNRYTVVPQQASLRGGLHCRPFSLELQGPQGSRRTQEVACRRSDGVWVAG